MKRVCVFNHSIFSLAVFNLGFLALAALTTSCGMVTTGGEGTTVMTSNSSISGLTTSGNSSLSSSSTNGFNCPALDVENVVPNFNFNYNGTGYFQVCTNPANPSQILVKGLGSTSAGDQICVFPAETSGAGTNFQQTNWVPGTTGLPLYQCGPASQQQGVAFSFPSGTNFNAAFIVDAASANQMYGCLQTDNPSYCPQQYSYGQFR